MVDHGQSLLLAGVRVEADRRVEPLAVLQDVQNQRHFQALVLLLDTQQGALQVQPKADLLFSSFN